jgi:hypothetical protein
MSIAKSSAKYSSKTDAPRLTSSLAKIGVVSDEATGGHPHVRVVAVLHSGQIQLDGREVTLRELADELLKAKAEGSTVEFDDAVRSHGFPPKAADVMNLIAANKLRVVVIKPSAAQDDSSEPARPNNVIELPGAEHFFAKVRRRAAGQRGVSLIGRDRTHFILPAPKPGAVTPQMQAAVTAIIPSEQPRNIAAIAPQGTLAGSAGRPPSLREAGRQIPFFGLLIGLGYTGHTVWIFEALPKMFPAGCEEADVLIVDSDAIAHLPQGWLEDAGAIMRNANILIYDRSHQKAGAVRTAGEVPGRIEFPNS